MINALNWIYTCIGTLLVLPFRLCSTVIEWANELWVNVSGIYAQDDDETLPEQPQTQQEKHIGFQHN